MCRLFGVSRGGYYQWSKQRGLPVKKSELDLVTKIKLIFEKSRKTYGVDRIQKSLAALGVKAGTRKISRIMRENSFRVVTVKKYKATTNSKHSLPVFENLLNQNFKAETPNQKWVSDITYVPTDEGWYYVAITVDLYQNKVVGWYGANHMRAELVIECLRRSVTRSKPTGGLIHHSDRGIQYASHSFRKELDKNKIRGSMSAKGNCYDNACAESFFGRFKS